ncbi:co-chaperone DjlA [Idiomarina seosinensis]|uniref:co-chaperone DjlA n=1 Tax=Idiomarina seosinensis TaxID=281739 RepID=UPI00384AFC78
MIWGKVIGAVAGYLFLRIPGAVIGAFIGHWFDRGMAQDFTRKGGFGQFLFGADKAVADATFLYTLFAVMGHLAKAKGRVTDQDIAQASALMDRLRLTGEARSEAQDAFREGKQPGFPLEKEVTAFREAFYGNRDVLQLFMEQLMALALNDGVLDKAEHEVLVTVGKNLGFTRFQIDQWLTMQKAAFRFHQRHQQSQGRQQQRSSEDDLKDAYQVLGVTSTQSDAEIKKAYRKLMARHHPDKLASKGLPDEVMKEAQERARDIQAAYDTIKSQRSMR